jgi:hypothetical protein
VVQEVVDLPAGPRRHETMAYSRSNDRLARCEGHRPFRPVSGSVNRRWQCYWQLYCLQRLAIKDREKLFESEYASLITES